MLDGVKPRGRALPPLPGGAGLLIREIIELARLELETATGVAWEVEVVEMRKAKRGEPRYLIHLAEDTE